MGILDFMKTINKADLDKKIPREEEKRFLQYVRDYALPGFREGKLAYANELQKVFLFQDAQYEQREAAQVFLERLQAVNTKQLIQLSEESRHYIYDESYHYGINWNLWNEAMKRAHHVRSAFMHLTDMQYAAMLYMGTFHSNGYYREMCLRALGECGLKLFSEKYQMYISPLPFYLLRMNDWVSEIRETAKQLALGEINQCDTANLLLVMPTLEKIRNSHRREQQKLIEIDDAILQKLKDYVHREDVSAIINYDVNARNAIYIFFMNNPVLTQEQMDWLLQHEKTGYGKKLLFSGITKFYGNDCLDIEKYLTDKCVNVRYCALNYKYSIIKNSWGGLEKMLLDNSFKIRDMVCFILRKHGQIDVLQFYMDSLDLYTEIWSEEKKRDIKFVYRKKIRISLLGIGENAGKESLCKIERYLSCADTAIVRAATQAYGMIMQEQGSDIYWKFLAGDALDCVNTAYKLINKYRISYDAGQLYEMYIFNKRSVYADRFIKLLLKCPSWSRLEYLLELCDDPEFSESMRDKIMEGCSRRSMYVRLSETQIVRLKEVLERKKYALPENLVKEIMFDLKYGAL